MSEWLAFQLHGPMVSWGDIAVGEFRPSWDHPTRSAVIGILCAALGIRRGEEEQLSAVANGYRFSFRLDNEGVPVRDYHTTQVPGSGSGKNRRDFLTRKEELSVSESQISTILSSRDYLCDSFCTVFVSNLPDAPYSLEELSKQLKNPVFTLYLGRKSCPPALPFAPQIIHADTLKQACEMVPPVSLIKSKHSNVRIFWEEGIESGIDAFQSQIRRDHPTSRKRWQFSGRSEYMGVICVNGGV